MQINLIGHAYLPSNSAKNAFFSKWEGFFKLHSANSLNLTKFQFYSVNVQVIGNHKRLLYNVVARHPGKAHDSRVWTYSEAKKWTEKQTTFLMAGKLTICYYSVQFDNFFKHFATTNHYPFFNANFINETHLQHSACTPMSHNLYSCAAGRAK